MNITINIPDSLPVNWWRQKIKELETTLIQEANRLSEKGNLGIKASENHDPWSNPEIECPEIDTGIEDFSLNHDHYLYGVPKKS